MTDEPKLSYAEVPSENFPFTIETYTVDGTVINTEVVSGPGILMAGGYGQPVGTRITWADGTVDDVPPPSQEEYDRINRRDDE